MKTSDRDVFIAHSHELVLGTFEDLVRRFVEGTHCQTAVARGGRGRRRRRRKVYSKLTQEEEEEAGAAAEEEEEEEEEGLFKGPLSLTALRQRYQI